MLYIGSSDLRRVSAFDPATMTWTIAHLANADSVSLHMVVKVNRVGTLENVARIR